MFWGMKPMEVRWLYVAIFRPTISFSSLVWWPGCQTASAKRRLSKVLRLACLEITGAIRTDPSDAMKALTVLPPLDPVIQGGGESLVAYRLWSLGVGLTLAPVKDIVVCGHDLRSLIP